MPYASPDATNRVGGRGASCAEEGMKAASDTGIALTMALLCREEAEEAAARGQWKRALNACERIARLVRLHGRERLLAAALAQTAPRLMPLAGAQQQRVRRVMELLNAAMESHSHDIDLAHALHDVLAMLAARLEKTDGRRKRALARLGRTYIRPLCARFPAKTAFADTLARLDAAAR